MYTHTHSHRRTLASKYSQIYVRTQTAIYHYQYVARSLAVALSHIACLCISPLRCDDNNCNNNKNNNNYILIQNAHLPHFNFHTLTCTSVLYLPAYERERERVRERERRTASLLERPLSSDGLSRNGCSLVCTFARSLRQSLLLLLFTLLLTPLSSFSIVSRSSCHFLAAIIASPLLA